MKYYKWIFDDDAIVVRKSDAGIYEFYFDENIGFGYDPYADYKLDFYSDLRNNPEKITEISEEEAYKIIKKQND